MSDFLNGLSLEMAERLYQKQVEKIESLKQELAEAKAILRESINAEDRVLVKLSIVQQKLTLAIEALEKISNMVTWVDEKNQKISHTYAMGTVDVARETLKQIRGENE